MAQSFVNVITLVSGAISIIGLGTSQSPPSERGNSMARITVGLDSADTGLNDAGGNVPQLLGLNNNQEQVGSSAPTDTILGKIGSGAGVNIEIGQPDATNGQQVPYLAVAATNDGLCIASIIMTWPDQQRRGWLGDIGAGCNQRWYPSRVIVNDDNYETACTWIDADFTDGTKSSGMTINFLEFYPADDTGVDNTDPQHYCNYPVMHWPNNAPAKRSISPRAANDTRLIVSGSKRFSAKDVCGSPTSDGPDYISTTDGLHCDMKTREVLPLCSAANSRNTDCFPLDSHRRSIEKRDGVSKYSKVLDWSEPMKA